MKVAVTTCVLMAGLEALTSDTVLDTLLLVAFGYALPITFSTILRLVLSISVQPDTPQKHTNTYPTKRNQNQKPENTRNP